MTFPFPNEPPALLCKKFRVRKRLTTLHQLGAMPEAERRDSLGFITVIGYLK